MEALSLVLGAALGAAVAWAVAMRRTARAEATVEARDLALEALRREMDEREAAMDRRFAQASERALNDATSRFLALAKGQFDGRAAEEQTALRAMLEPMHRELDALERLTHEAGKENAARLGELKGQIEGVSRVGEALANALKKPQVRGSWGEGQLVAILESSGLVAGKSFVVQDQTDRDGRVLLRTDVVILLPRGRRIVIDSKAPLDAYLAAVEAEGEAEKARLCGEHARDGAGTRPGPLAEGVLEPVRRVARVHDPLPAVRGRVPDRVRGRPRRCSTTPSRQRIILANPMTLMNLVHLATYVLNEERLAENAEEVRLHARALCDRLGRAVELIGRHGRHLRLAAESYNELVGSVGSRLLPAANRIRDLGAGLERPLETPDPIDVAIRPLAAPESAASNPEP